MIERLNKTGYMDMDKVIAKSCDTVRAELRYETGRRGIFSVLE